MGGECLALLSLIACGKAEGPGDASTGAPPAAAPPAAAPAPPGPAGGAPPALAAMGRAEDLSSSWDAALAVPAESGEGISCPEGALPVPAGRFLMGSASAQAGRDEQPVHPVLLGAYCLDRSEVRAGDFSAWLLREGRRPGGLDPRNMDGEGVLEPGRGDFPAEGVTWEEARDYCASVGGALPTEAQWEKAARGGCELGEDPAACDPADLRAYPWGSEAPSCELANHQLVDGRGPHLCRSDTYPVGTHGRPGPYGHMDLAGNVWEYVADWYHPGVYSRGRQRVDPGGPAAGRYHVMRGGSWNTFSTNMRAANRFSDSVLGSAVGFRCAYGGPEPVADPVRPVAQVVLSGTITRGEGLLEGRRLYVTAFDAEDTGPQGMPVPGQSPAAEVILVPGGGRSQSFSLEVPAGRSYFVFSALDDGSGGEKQGYISSSSSGGFGRAEARIDGATDVEGIAITLGPPPGGRPPGGPR